jgi:hypothetical protein
VYDAEVAKGSFAFASGIKLSPEFVLAAACALWPPGEPRNAAIRHAAGNEINWQRLIAVTERQGLAGLVNDGLSRAKISVPSRTAQMLAASAHAVALKNLALVAEAVRLKDVFKAACIPVLFVKGPTLAVLAYDTIALRPTLDLDLLVPEPQVMAAAALMAQLGYRRTQPGPETDMRQIATWMRARKDFHYVHDTRGIIVELHWRLVENSLLLKAAPASVEAVEVPIAPRISLPTLAMDDLLVYLAMHGANHGWARLKWVADLAALLAVDGSRVDRILDLAERDGVSRGVWQLLLIAHLLFGTAVPARLHRDPVEERIVHWLARTALAVMTRDGGTTGPNDRAFGAVGISISRFLMKPGWRFKLQQLRTVLVSSDDWLLLKLPPQLQPLYPVLRVPMWLARRVSRARQQNPRPRKNAIERTHP